MAYEAEKAPPDNSAAPANANLKSPSEMTLEEIEAELKRLGVTK